MSTVSVTLASLNGRLKSHQITTVKSFRPFRSIYRCGCFQHGGPGATAAASLHAQSAQSCAGCRRRITGREARRPVSLPDLLRVGEGGQQHSRLRN